jgi:hypothetical protein
MMIIQRKVRPSIRLLCCGVGGFLLSGVALCFRAYGLEGAAPLALVAGTLFVVGTIGGLEDADEPPATERFHELADPARTLSSDVSWTAPAEAVHHDVHGAAKPGSRSYPG